MLVFRALAFALFLLAGPQALAANDSCLQLGNIFCSMEYIPSRCTLANWYQQPLTPPIVAEGTNECFAHIALRSEVCSRGLDPDQLPDQFVECVVVPDPSN